MRRRSFRRGGGGGGNFGLMLLIFQLIGFVQYLSSHNEFVPTTLILIGINIIAFIRPDLHNLRQFRSYGGHYLRWPSIAESCISVHNVWYDNQWIRIVMAPFIHADSWHLYYNMASFMWKARTLEKRYGSIYFAYLIAVFTVLTGILYVGINYFLAEFTDSWSYTRHCAVGFSGVIFAIKVLTTHLQPNQFSYVMGIGVPNKLVVWAELVIISVLNPRASFVGHLAGILVGVAFVSGPLKLLMDLPLNILSSGTPVVNFGRRSYNYTAHASGRRERHGNDTQTDRDLQEALRRSLADRDNERQRRPPPYNPDYIEEEEEGEGEGDIRQNSDPVGSTTSEETLDPLEARRINDHVRTARLKRFEQQNSPSSSSRNNNFRRRPLS